MELDETHDPALRSFVASANAPDGDFPIQNLPYAVFRRRGDNAPPRVGVAIGAEILDIAAVAGLMDGVAAGAAAACASPHLNALMERGPEAWAASAHGTVAAVAHVDAAQRKAVETHLTPIDDAELLLPVRIGNFTDFFASIFHATNAGRLFRPDNPLMPNYKYVPVAYHSRASSVRVSGMPVRRPRGQTKRPDEAAPVYRASHNLDYELELGFYIGTPSALGEPVPIADAGDHVFGFCLLNDWSARDIQAWESQPLGPFLAKNFATTVSPFVVTAAALAPYRTRAYARPQGDPAPLPHLTAAQDQAIRRPRHRHGGLSAHREDARRAARRRSGSAAAPSPMSTGRWRRWSRITPAMAAISKPATSWVRAPCPGRTRESWASLLELTQRGKEPIALPNGETRGYVEDGDEIIFRGHCAKPGFARLGFGECRAVIAPAAAV